MADTGELNPCLECDETNCGPAFKKCAGANRRRCGISTDINRSDDDMCHIAQPDVFDSKAMDPVPKETVTLA